MELTSAQAVELQALRFCTVTPTHEHGMWRIADVTRVGVASISDLQVIVTPKAALRSIVFMASYGGAQLALEHDPFDFDIDQSVPVALAGALQVSVARATRHGLLKGYRSRDDATSVVRGRWDVTRQLARRPGVPLPLEVTYDDFTEDILENRILRSALRRVLRFDGIGRALRSQINAQLALFSEVEVLPVGLETPNVLFTRRNAHYSTALLISRWILEAVSWAHARGAARGSTFLVNMADIFEKFVGEALRSALKPQFLDVEVQFRDWRLDVGGAVRLRPDIVVLRDGNTVTVADTKYKVWGASTKSPPNADVYQALAYALTAGVEEAHLIYVSGDIEPRIFDIASARKRVIAHALDIGGSPAALMAGVDRLAAATLRSPVPT
ncbi:McrC family protein [Agromyces sp. NPDC055661]